MNIPRILGAVVEELVKREQLELVPGASAEALTREVLAAIEENKALGHLGSFVSKVIIRSELVEELYADDRDIARLVGEVGMTVR